MFHATSAGLARLVLRFRDQGLDRQRQLAAVYGWQVERVAFGAYRYRDPRFDTLRDPPASRPLACHACGAADPARLVRRATATGRSS
jgi:hypothetical protein